MKDREKFLKYKEALDYCEENPMHEITYIHAINGKKYKMRYNDITKEFESIENKFDFGDSGIMERFVEGHNLWENIDLNNS